MNTYTVKGTYGSGKTKTEIFVYEYSNGAKWYAAKGSSNVNKTHNEIQDGVNIEELQDFDTFSNTKPINTISQFIKAIES